MGNALATIEHTSITRASNDEMLIGLWMNERAITSQRVMSSDVRFFIAWVNKPLAQVTLEDIQDFKISLRERYERATQARMLMSVKSLFSFAKNVGYLPFNVASLVKADKVKDTLNERILSEQEVFTILAKEANKRDHAIIGFLYYSAARVSEASRVTWKDIRILEDGSAQVTLFGKGDETRIVTLRESLVNELLTLDDEQLPDTPLFKSRKGGALTSKAIWDVVKRTAKKAGFTKEISPHWFRHAHATHALDRGATITLVSETLGHANIAVTGRYTHVAKHKSSSDFLA